MENTPEASMLLLGAFYDRVFPFAPYGRWLAYGGGPKQNEYFTHREFAFTLPDNTFVRPLSFTSMDALQAKLRQLKPIKFDLGAVYSVPPAQKRAVHPSAYVPREKELVVDIDMTDYDDLRTCCRGGAVCRRCWPLMAAAQRVLDASLRDDFGFKHILWVFSGRRGIHGWVCDAAARALPDDARLAIVKYLDLARSASSGNRKLTLPPVLHPALQRAYDQVLRPAFVRTVLVGQQLLAHPSSAAAILSAIPDASVRASVAAEWDRIGKGASRRPPHQEDDDEEESGDSDASDDDTSEVTAADGVTYRRDPPATTKAKWRALETKLQQPLPRSSSTTTTNNNNTNTKQTQREMVTLARDLIFQAMYPRLDANVTTHVNHMLKSPLCVHPGTGKVCVPIAIEDCDSFDPTTVPTVVDLIGELNSSMDVDDATPGWAKTSLKPYVEHFLAFIRDMEADMRLASRGTLTF
ncbi:hypothetical protein BC828DRAFT_397276 [Blastocladiella britannica]|nr:hypothetical protein BC828DRAFT_397276 [Blastocladiella britannica]